MREGVVRGIGFRIMCREKQERLPENYKNEWKTAFIYGGWVIWS